MTQDADAAGPGRSSGSSSSCCGCRFRIYLFCVFGYIYFAFSDIFISDIFIFLGCFAPYAAGRGSGRAGSEFWFDGTTGLPPVPIDVVDDEVRGKMGMHIVAST